MLIPSKYVIEEGKEAPEGTIVFECGVCKKKFAIPADEAKDMSIYNPVCEGCQQQADKAAAATSVADMKADTAASTADTIKKALGN